MFIQKPAPPSVWIEIFGHFAHMFSRTNFFKFVIFEFWVNFERLNLDKFPDFIQKHTYALYILRPNHQKLYTLVL